MPRVSIPTPSCSRGVGSRRTRGRCRAASWIVSSRRRSRRARSPHVAAEGSGRAGIRAEDTNVFPRLLDLEYPSVERGEGVWLTTTAGQRILDACSGGAMVACLGHGERRVIAAAAEQAGRISYMYNHHFTNDAQERLADRLIEVAAPEMSPGRVVSGGPG